jgi:hypothetical protein
MIGMKYENLVQDLKYIIPTKQQFLVPPSFRGEDCFQYFSQCLLVSEEKIVFNISANQFSIFQPIRNRIAHGDHVFRPTGIK